MSSLPVCNSNNISVYRVAGSASNASNLALPKWLAPSRRGSLKDSQVSDSDRKGSIELIQDFGFPEAAYKIKISRDGLFAMCTGVYKPHIKVFEFSEMSMKFERHTDSENVDFVLLSDDWTKSAHLQADRTVQLHTRYGLHHTVRLPRFGRAITYHPQSCDILVAASSPDVYRLNLELGQFSTPFTTRSPNINAIDVCSVSQLLGFGGSDGFVELWDARAGSHAMRFVVPSASRESNLSEINSSSSMSSAPEITALSFRPNGIQIGLGTSAGTVLLYDLRHPVPLTTKDHMYGESIKKIVWHEITNHVVTADRRCVRVWDVETGSSHCTIEPPCDINDVCVVPNTGMIFIPAEDPRIHAFLIPSLGPAPRFCSFLDNLTEEMAIDDPLAASNTIYENYRFVTRKELRALSLEHVIGTSAAKAYMHGYFIHQKLYEKAKLIANPFAYEEYRANLVRSKLEAKRGSRISSATKRNKKVKVNQTFANKMGGPTAVDERFGQVFSNEDFFIDEESETFKLINPTQRSKISGGSSLSLLKERAGESSEEEDYEDCKAGLKENNEKVSSSEEEEKDTNSSDESLSSDEEYMIPQSDYKQKQREVSNNIQKKDRNDRIVPSRRPDLRTKSNQNFRQSNKNNSTRTKDSRHSVFEVSSQKTFLRKQSFGKRLQENPTYSPGLATFSPHGAKAMRFGTESNNKVKYSSASSGTTRPVRRKFTQRR